MERNRTDTLLRGLQTRKRPVHRASASLGAGCIQEVAVDSFQMRGVGTVEDGVNSLA